MLIRFFAVFMTVTICFGVEYRTKFVDGNVEIEMLFEASDLKGVEVSHGLQKYFKFDNSIGHFDVGFPDIPVFHFWVAVDPDAIYKLEVSHAGRKTEKNILLYPVQGDYLEDDGPPPFSIDRQSYIKSEWLGTPTAKFLGDAKLSNVSLKLVQVTPIHYHPWHRELRSYSSVKVRIFTDSKKVKKFLRGDLMLNPFVQQQLSHLVVNGKDLLDSEILNQEKSMLILAPSDLLKEAEEYRSLLHGGEPSVFVEEVSAQSSPSQIKTRILEWNQKQSLSSVLIFGDEKLIPLYSWSGEVPGDVYYSHLRGNDYIADIGVGRIPVSDKREADLIVNKGRKYLEHFRKHSHQKNVMLIAHKQEYPGKYTANLERVRSAPNPKSLNYVTQYGGAGATNTSVLDNFPSGFGIINYRGHGSNVAWTGWDKAGRSFGSLEVDKLNNEEINLPVFFSIACSNGAIQNTQESIAERLLFPNGQNPNTGAIAVVAATMASSTETNHRFNQHLFEFLQKNEYPTLSEVYTLANNKLVQDAGGKLPGNVKMYLLLGDPLLEMM